MTTGVSFELRQVRVALEGAGGEDKVLHIRGDGGVMRGSESGKLSFHFVHVILVVQH